MSEKKRAGRPKGKKAKANGANGRRRTNGTGTLERRGARWLARWYVYDAHGNRLRKSQIIEAEGIDAARERLRELTEGNALMSREKEIRRDLAKLEGVAAQRREWEDKQPATTLQDAFDEYERSGLRPDSGERTLADYRGYFDGFLSWIATNRPDYIELRDVTQADAEAYAADLKTRTAAGTYNKRVVFFRCLWRVLAESKTAKLVCNPWERIRKREVVEHTRRELTIEELVKVCGSLTGEMRTLFAVGVYSGLRLGDAALLDWGAVDLARLRIALIPRKTKRHAHGKPVIIPIHPALASILAETPPDERTGYVVPELAELYTRNDSLLCRRISAVFAAAGIATQSKREGERAKVDVGFHSLRHSFVSLSANAGTPLVLVQAIVGHSNPAMTRHYFHESENALTNAVAALPDVTGADTKPEVADAVAGRFRSFCAAWDALRTDEERAKAFEYVAAHGGRATA